MNTATAATRHADMSDEPIPSTEFVIADRRGQDRRGRPDRRKREIPVAVERRAGSGIGGKNAAARWTPPPARRNTATTKSSS